MNQKNNILNQISELKNWDYYKKDEEHSLIAGNKWNSEDEHKDFINKYLKIAGKEGILNNFEFKFKFKINDIDRAIHTNSVFFLGCLFYEKLGLKEKINFLREDGHDEFTFVWFLTSLVHDHGYKIEKDGKQSNQDINDCIGSFKREFNIENDLLSNNKNEFLNNAYNSYDNKVKKIIEFIPEYYKKRFNVDVKRSKDGKIDHGIASGLLLYDALVKNRVERKSQEKNEQNGLYWGEELDEFYAIASYAIAIHNMRRKYIVENVEELKFSIEEEPFLFLFSLVDTFEPTKIFDGYDASYVLENILIDFKDNKIIIENAKDSNLKFDTLYAKLKDLESWLDLEVIENEDNIILEIKGM